jgi:26S proteasome non-ATPase regulatory subunit 9
MEEENQNKPATTIQTSELYQQLVAKKLEIENQLSELGKILKEEGNVGLEGSLIDREGYPRADIDIYKVRLTRQQINCLRNDYKAVMDEIELELSEIYANINREKHARLSSQADASSQVTTGKPFAKVTQVDADSPALEAGIHVNDLIVQFGPHTASNTNAKNFAQISQLVQRNEDKIILLLVIRGDGDESSSKAPVRIKLTPKKWTGHGLLGCKIVPID